MKRRMYHIFGYFDLYKVIVLLLLIKRSSCYIEFVCDKRPLGSDTDPLRPDSQFLLSVNGLYDDKYLPDKEYTIKLKAKNSATFIAFTISAIGDVRSDPINPRNKIYYHAGQLTINPKSFKNDAMRKDNCNNTIVQTDISPKTSVEALWTAPPKNNHCVTIKAYVMVKPDVWYDSEGPLSMRICEDNRKAEDKLPSENEHCSVCEDARYQVTFEGTWSLNTHPGMFPNVSVHAKFSDLVGASHSNDFYLFKLGTEATNGLRILAEQGNTTQFEIEILKKLADSVRTIIKANGMPHPNMTTTTSFRATKTYHYLSVVSAIRPSPDWFLGVSRMELCAENNTWLKNIRYNLYPMDAGTDSGKNFDSPNEESMPKQEISRADINPDVPREQVKPFAKLRVDLIRTYPTSNCEETTTVAEDADKGEEEGEGEGDGEEESGGEAEEEEERKEEEANQEPPPETTPEPEPEPDQAALDAECPTTPWEDWGPCEGKCVNGRITHGFSIRFRYHKVDGKVVGKYFEDDTNNDKEVSEKCLEAKTTFEYKDCDDPCENPTAVPDLLNEAQRRVWSGSSWRNWK